MKLIHNVNVYYDEIHSVRNGAIAFDEKVIKIIKPEEVEEWKKRADELIDGLGYDLLPGYIDVHVHGGYGYDFLEETWSVCGRRTVRHSGHRDPRK